MKHIHHFLLVLFITVAPSLFAIQTNQNKKEEGTATTIEIPAEFFKGMFRVPDDKYLVAWHGSVTVTSVTASNGKKELSGSIQPFVKQLNAGSKRVYYTYFIYNMKDGEKEIITKNGKEWVAQCGLKAGRNISTSSLNGKEMTGFPPDITSDVWSKNYSFKRSYPDPETHKTIVVQYRVEATSIYFYHKKPTDLKGKITRNDQYHLCGSMVFKRLGPGLNGRGFEEQAKIENDQYNFRNKLFRGDYQISFRWPHGKKLKLEQDFIYNPTDSRMISDFEISPMFQGNISGKVIYKATKKPVKNYPVKLKPVCEQSGLPEKESFTDEQGEYIFHDIPAGEYYVAVKGADNENAFLTNPNKKKVIVENSEVTPKYNIYAYYHAPGFVKVGVVWRNSIICFPDEGEKPQVFDVMAYQQAGGTGEPKGTDGKTLHVPYSMTLPMVGKQTIYSNPEDEYETPQLLYAKSLGGPNGIPAFRLNKKRDALNSCHIVSTNGGPIHLELSIDLNGVSGDVEMQFAIRSINNVLGHMNLPAFPTNFKVIRLNSDDIEHFKKYGKVEKTVSNGKATIKVVFEPEK